jgi:HAD superfamily hydrolase (TIGR01509 family)
MKSGSTLQAVIFDLDGVITLTARVHAAAWKELFDEFLRDRSEQLGETFQPFDKELEYDRFVDGKPRIDGIVSFLAARGIQVRLGTPTDLPIAGTAWGLGNRKNELFRLKLQQMGVDVDREAVRVVRELRSMGVKTGLASSSKNALLILERSQLRPLFDAIVDGVVGERLHLRGKPEPDIFLHCLHELNPSTQPRDAAVVEDAISGVEAGKQGGFGLVIGVDREGTGNLQRQGADWVIRSFWQITANQIVELLARRNRAA